jgi:hypothetical protein
MGADARPGPTRELSPARAHRLSTIANRLGWRKELTNGANGPVAVELATLGAMVEKR